MVQSRHVTDEYINIQVYSLQVFCKSMRANEVTWSLIDLEGSGESDSLRLGL